MLIIAQVLKENWLKTRGFCSFKNEEKKVVNEAANDSALVSGKIEIAGFGGFRPPASVKQIKLFFYLIS